MTSPDLLYQQAAEYRAKVARIIAKAVSHLEQCNVEWRHVNIYKCEVDAIEMPAHCTGIREEAYATLRSLVNYKQ